jgi:hypothetical protein
MERWGQSTPHFQEPAIGERIVRSARPQSSLRNFTSLAGIVFSGLSGAALMTGRLCRRT